MKIFNATERRATPLISVITICRNAADFIQQCIESVVAQNFDDFEYVVIDGGSTDGTQPIIEKYSDYIAYWHSKPDRGLSHAFNLGVEHSRGKWLFFLNADDIFVSPNVLCEVAANLRVPSEADVIFGQVAVVDRSDWTCVKGGPYGGQFSWRSFMVMNTIPHQGAFISRELFSRVGMYTEKLALAADYELFLRAGPTIDARCIPLLVAYMRDGGVSKRNQYKCIAEWHSARMTNAVAAKWKLRLIYIYLLCRGTAGMIYRNLIDVIKTKSK